MANENASGLEGHLRNLILGNAGPNAEAPPSHGRPDPVVGNARSYPDPLAQAAAEGTPRLSHDEVTQQDEPDTQAPPHAQPKTTKKRPNQAQRRQMNAQFTIPIDTRPQYPDRQFRDGAPSYGHQTRPQHSYNRHADPGTHTHPSSSFAHNQADNRFSTRPWDNQASGYAGRGSDHHHPQNSHFPRGQSFASHDRGSHGPPRHNQGFNGSHSYRPHQRPEVMARQSAFLDALAYQVVANSEIDRSEIAQKEGFRQQIETISRLAIAQHEAQHNSAQEFPPFSVELKCFGSLASGFATKASDMDLGLLSPLSRIPPDAAGSPIPRLLEKAFLDAGLGARLLTRTRVPIIKLCQHPPAQLRQGLLEEREKWENGITHETAEDEDHDEHTAHAQDDDPTESASAELGEVNAATEFEVPSGANGEMKRFQLKQGNKSLQAYHALAKRVLRKAGGRDVTISNYRDFSAQDWAILDGVCQAFVNGLSDSKIKEQLALYPSLRFLGGYRSANHRSLLGVFTQVEGEHILHTWNTWPANEHFETQSRVSDQVLNIWEDTQRKTNFANDPILYNKELQYALDKLKKLPFLQLVSLEQGQSETPSRYHARATSILRSLSSQAQGLSVAALQGVIDRYIYGIHQKEVRNAVRLARSESPSQWDLDAVSCCHKSLHLAREFERAVEKGLYDETCVDVVRTYIDILRSPLQPVQSVDGKIRFIVAFPQEHSALVPKIRALQDPHTLGPNQARDKYHDRLEFPKSGAGIQCDINFSAHLALQNTLLLRCYSHTDPRVRPLVLFVKHWAKVRGINSGYRGTLSSYGYVLMVLHYLVNVVQPFVCPNLQKLAQPPPPDMTAAQAEDTILCKGYDVQFWRNEAQILQLARDNQLNHNTETVGQLLRGFFEYYAQPGMMSSGSCRGFDWGRDVLSLRTHGGLITKQEKGWTGAKTTLEVQSSGATSNVEDTHPAVAADAATALEGASADAQTKHGQPQSKPSGVKEVRHRYLFAIEDPFEHDHNVARTVTHNGIVSIRDEFRRAWAILQAAGREQSHDELLKDVNELEASPNTFLNLLDELHGANATVGVKS